MPTVQFEGNFFGDDAEVEVPQGGALVDICDSIDAPVPFSCRSATCGTCRVEVVSGLGLFEAPEAEELELLRALGDAANIRLACQAQLKPGPGLVTLRISDDEL